MGTSWTHETRFLLIALIVTLVWPPADLEASPKYSYWEPTANLSSPNDLGQVASSYAPGVMALFDGLGDKAGRSGRDLNNLNSPRNFDRANGGLILLNNSGQVAWSQSAVLSNNGDVTKLGTFGGSYSHASAINNSGQVTGAADLPDGTAHAYTYSDGVMHDLGTLPGGNVSTSLAINDSGDAVGYSDLEKVPGPYPWGIDATSGAHFYLFGSNGEAMVHATLFEDGGVTDLGTLGGLSSYASGINNSGLVVGSSLTASGDSHAFTYQNGKMTDLGMINTDGKNYFPNQYSSATAVNDAGQIVGSSNSHAFLFENGKMLDLNSMVSLPPHTTLLQAYSINNLGQIMAEAINDDSGFLDFHTYLLTPSELGVPSYNLHNTPEPTTLTFAGMLAAWFGGRLLASNRARRRRKPV